MSGSRHPIVVGLVTGVVWSLVVCHSQAQLIHEFEAELGWAFYGTQDKGAVGDLDGDGYPELVARAYALPNVDHSVVHVFSGNTGEVLTTLRAPSAPTMWYGGALNGPGDLDGDGLADVLVAHGGFERQGAVRLFSGVSSAESFMVEPDDSSDEELFGWQIDGGVDFNGDGVGDFVVMSKSPYARVTAYSGAGGRKLATLFGYRSSTLSQDMQVVGDLDSDGFADLAWGSGLHQDQPGHFGTTRVYSGASWSQIAVALGPDSSNTGFGAWIAPLGDVNADGFDDIAISAPTADSDTLTDAGFVRAYLGPNLTPHYTVYGEVLKDRFGHHLVGGGDVNGDGVLDFAASNLSVNNDPGLIRAISGADGSEILSFTGETIGAGLRSLGLADVNQNGLADVVAAVSGGASGAKIRVYSANCGSLGQIAGGCAAGGPTAPTLDVSGCATPGGIFQFTMISPVFPTQAFLVFGPPGSPQLLPGGCALQINPVLGWAAQPISFPGLWVLGPRGQDPDVRDLRHDRVPGPHPVERQDPHLPGLRHDHRMTATRPR